MERTDQLFRSQITMRVGVSVASTAPLVATGGHAAVVRLRGSDARESLLPRDVPEHERSVGGRGRQRLSRIEEAQRLVLRVCPCQLHGRFVGRHVLPHKNRALGQRREHRLCRMEREGDDAPRSVQESIEVRSGQEVLQQRLSRLQRVRREMRFDAQEQREVELLVARSIA